MKVEYTFSELMDIIAKENGITGKGYDMAFEILEDGTGGEEGIYSFEFKKKVKNNG